MGNTGKIIAVCISEKKGVQKKEVPSGVLVPDWGIEGDAHAGKWHRQVSLLSYDKVNRFRESEKMKTEGTGGSADVSLIRNGAFGENLLVEGIDLSSLPVGTGLQIGECFLVVSQIGKACHSHCEIYKKMGDCIMPREGIFAEVIKGGTVRPGDEVKCIPQDKDSPFTAAVITLSDRAFEGSYEDRSGPVIESMLTEAGYVVKEKLLLPDGKEKLAAELRRLSDQRQINVIFTTGGTGFSERDLTPEATKEVCDREVPGIGEALRAYSLTITKNAILSRQTAGIRKRSLIINLPGSPKAVREDLEYLLPALGHGLGILRGTEGD